MNPASDKPRLTSRQSKGARAASKPSCPGPGGIERWRGFLCAALWLFFSDAGLAQTVPIWTEGFENGLSADWSIGGGVWQVGMPLPPPAPGPGGAFEGVQCAGTGFAGNYPPNATATLTRITPFVVPPADLSPQLEFFDWRQNGPATGSVQISTNNGPWVTLTNYTGDLMFWNREFLNLSAYAGASAQIRFLFQSGDSILGAGWYLDQISVVREALISTNTPTIVRQPVGKTVPVGGSVSFVVVADGSEPLQYQWRLNGANIPGQTNNTFSITNVQPGDAGNYSVLVANTLGVVGSDVAALTVLIGQLPFADNFAQSVRITNESDVGQGSNVNATSETGEPAHAAKTGGKSVWLTWTPDRNGIAVFSTRGSDFDTLLAVYTGNILTNLNPVASDDDSGGFFTSQLTFSATAGVDYHIAVDGLLEVSGNIVLGWQFTASPDIVPQILSRPQAVVYAGSPAALKVKADQRAQYTYQWEKNGEAVLGATASTLFFNQVAPEQVGAYTVVVRNGSQAVRTEAVPVEIGSTPGPPTHDKLADVYGDGGLPDFMPVQLGSLGQRLLDNSLSTTESGEPIDPTRYGGASRVLGIELEADGDLDLDTIGSKINTILSLYALIPPGESWLDVSLVAQDDTGSAGGGQSKIKASVTAGRYLIVVDGVDGTTGPITLNWHAGLPPQITLQPASLTLPAGTNALLQVLETNDLYASYQWYKDGSPISQATNDALAFPFLHLSDSGVYYATVENAFSSVASSNATLTVLGFELSEPSFTLSQQFGFSFPAILSKTNTIQISRDLLHWATLDMLVGTTNMVKYVDLSARNAPIRFYRVSTRP